MTLDGPNHRLNLISTRWTLLNRACGDETEARAARHDLLTRYGGAVRRYLLGAVRDEDAADDLFQEFVCRLLRGGVLGAERGRGRFRDYLKGALAHLIADFHRAKQRQPQALPENFAEPAAGGGPGADDEAAFRASWREELLARAWGQLEEFERRSGQPVYSVLHFRAAHPELRSPDLAAQLGLQLGRELTAVGVRQLLHRARERFADLLLDDVTESLDTPTEDELDAELIELGLLEYCRPALARRRGGHDAPPAVAP